MAKAFDWLSGKEYAAVQRALRSIWYGEPAPCAEAAQAMSVDQERLEQQLATFANLIVDALPFIPQAVTNVHEWHQIQLTRKLLSGLEARLPILEQVETQQQRIRAQIAEVKAKTDSYLQPLAEEQRRLKDVQHDVSAVRSRVKQRHAEKTRLCVQLASLEMEISQMKQRLHVMKQIFIALAAELGEERVAERV